MKILFVDHSKVSRSVWERMVIHAGHEPLIAETGEAGLGLLEVETVDLICVSLSLPDLDGIRFTRRARTLPHAHNVPIVILTSAQDTSTRRRAFEAGATDICPKTGIRELFERASKMISGRDSILSGRVLYVEDSLTVTRIMTRLFEKMGLTVDHFVNASKALAQFDETVHDLVVSDILVEGEMSGIALVSELRASWPDKTRVPILAMSGMDDDIRRVELFRLGVNDFITKPIVEEEAAARVRNLVVQKQLFDQVQQQRIQLYEMAMTDPLTGLYNRHSLTEFAAKISGAANRHDQELSVILIDLDHFKAINDEHGHLVGDRVLARVSGLLLRACRQEDFAVRFGGEEMLLILRDCPLAAARSRAEELCRRIEALVPAGLTITASLGVTARKPGTEATLDELIDTADQAVYAAKSKGRNQVRVREHQPNPTPPPTRRASAA